LSNSDFSLEISGSYITKHSLNFERIFQISNHKKTPRIVVKAFESDMDASVSDGRSKNWVRIGAALFQVPLCSDKSHFLNWGSK